MNFDYRKLLRGPLPWALLVTVVVMALPIATFIRNRTFERPVGQVFERKYGAVAFGGIAYTVREDLSLPFGSSARGIHWKLESDYPVIDVEVVAPSPDGRFVWVVDHPPNPQPGARVRRFSADGKLLSTFRTMSGGTIFTPGFADDLWFNVASSGGFNEIVVHVDASGKELGRFDLPKGVFARSLAVAPDGRVWALNEEWKVDPVERSGVYVGTLVPLVLRDGKPPKDPVKESVSGTFVGADNNVYSLEGSATAATSDYPEFMVTVLGPDGTFVRSMQTPHGYRPYAADSQGRVYSENVYSGKAEAPGISSVGDVVALTTDIVITEPTGSTSFLPVQRRVYTGLWAPSAWPTAEGDVYSATLDEVGLHVRVSSPTETRVRVAEAEPPAPDMRILYSGRPPESGDPYRALDDRERDLWRLIYSPLVSHDASLNPVPELAASVPTPGKGVSRDGRTITWEIAKGRTWHDGKPVVPADVVATWEYLRVSRTVSVREPFPGFDHIVAVVAKDDSVEVTLSRPFGAAPESFFPFILPGHVVANTARTANAGIHAAPVGSGPFALERWQRDGTWMLQRHEATRPVSAPRTVDVVFNAHEGGVDTYMGSEIPAVWTWVPPLDSARVRRDAIGSVDTAWTGRWKGMVFNTAHGPGVDPRVRKALAEAIPYHTVTPLIAATGNTTHTAGAFAVEGLDPSSVPSTATMSAVEARRTLSAAGWNTKRQGVLFRGSEPLDVVYSQTFRNGFHEVLSEEVDVHLAWWKSLGASTSWRFGQEGFYDALTVPSYLARGRYLVGGGTFPGYLDPAWGSVFDPADTPSRANPDGTSITFTSDPTLRSLHESARRTYNRTERARIAEKITARVLALDLAVFEAAESRDTAVLGVSGVKPAPYPAGDFWNVGSWRVEGGR